MKSIFVFILLFGSLTLSAQKGEKLFGDICFGMSKNEIKKVVSNDKLRHTFSVNGYRMCPLIGQSYYEESGLCILFMSMQGVRNETMYEGNCRTTLLETDSIMNSLGAKISYKNDYWPNPLAIGDKSAVIYSLKGNSITLYSSPNLINSGYTFTLYMAITTHAYEDKVNGSGDKELDNNIKDAKDKF